MKLPRVERFEFTWIEVCVPKNWPDDVVVAFAQAQYPCSRKPGWVIKLPTQQDLLHAFEQCPDSPSFHHVRLDA